MRDKLEKEVAKFPNDRMALKNCIGRYQVLKKKVKEIRSNKKDLYEKYARVDKERDDMY